MKLTELDGKRARPRDTVQPLATDLGLTVDISCDRDDAKCVEDVVKGYKGPGNILICWEHDALSDIVDELGAKKSNVPQYPDDKYAPSANFANQAYTYTYVRFNIIWTDPFPYDEGVISQTSENCPGLD